MRSVIALFFSALLVSKSFAHGSWTTARQSGRYFQRKAACLDHPRLTCAVRPTVGNTATGVVQFFPVWMRNSRGWHECNVRIKAKVTGLEPGKHGFHIHTYGDISASDGTSTGGHFTNPDEDDIPHGFSGQATRHWGDLNNIVSNKEKKAKYNRIDRLITLEGILGRGVTIHAEDDKGPRFQPSGGAGPRVATCVIGYANPDI